MFFAAFPDFTLSENGRVLAQDGARAAPWWQVSASFAGPWTRPVLPQPTGP